ncbi:DNA-binding protein [Stutzerimonas stutzeri]|jgi:chromosome segregation ATPase|uniref:Capsule polysaccharide export protein n=1 Tax=Stutzerimonas stutzeri RCH2 TaxID=644801 RepID=L0GU06_STUST|nr:DNA-binding protein [Stutzerimonas stutzeri]AGA88860.1 capsule polysaccharide export protein [Stutzerimonas stutzeri RCH2]
MALVTFESVAAAAEAISKDGGRPSVRAVIAQLGGGSPNTVLPMLNEWKAGRVAVRSADIELDPRIGQIVAELVTRASEQAAKSAEERAADVQADAETVAEAGREAELRAEGLQGQLDKAIQTITLKERALEDAQAAAAIEAKNAEEKATALKNQLAEERSRADQAVQAVAKAEVRLELIPGLQAEVERLKPFEQKTAVLTANLDAANATAGDLKGRLDAALLDAKEAHAELEKVRISEQSLQAKLDAALREIESLKASLGETKTELATARQEAKEARAETKEVRAALAQAPTKGE